MIILVAGLPGSGKSYFARHLAQLLDAEYINSDQVRDQLGFRGKYSSDDKQSVYSEMSLLAQKGLHLNTRVVLDATFYLESIREIFFKLALDNRVPVYIMEVVAEESLIRQRLKKERKDSEADFAVYRKLKKQFEPIAENHLRLASTNDNIKEMLELAMSYIKGLDARK